MHTNKIVKRQWGKNKLAGYFGLVVLVSVALIACDRPGRSQARDGKQAPTQGFVRNVAAGKQLFNANCARCHGAELAGTDRGPPLLHKIYRPAHHADISFQMAVKNGSPQHHWHFGDMPSIPGVSALEVEHIVAYVRQKQQQAGIQ